jgi:hypothetical protein
MLCFCLDLEHRIYHIGQGTPSSELLPELLHLFLGILYTKQSRSTPKCFDQFLSFDLERIGLSATKKFGVREDCGPGSCVQMVRIRQGPCLQQLFSLCGMEIHIMEDQVGKDTISIQVPEHLGRRLPVIWVMSPTLIVVLNDIRLGNVVVDVICSNTGEWFVLLKPLDDLLVANYLRVTDEIVVMLVHRLSVLVPFPNKLLSSQFFHN